MTDPQTSAPVAVATEATTPQPTTTEYDGQTYRLITEGQATILFPDTNEVFYNPVQQFNRDMSIAAIRTWSEIYFEEQKARAERKTRLRAERQAAATKPDNPAASAQLKAEKDGENQFTILEALSATGLRSVRYALEIPHVKRIVANDLEPDAVKSIRRNLVYNGLLTRADADADVDTASGIVRPNLGDACAVMYQSRSNPLKQFHVVDLDPYGSAAQFIDGAVQAVIDGGLLCVTCTDLAVLAGSNYPEVCFAKYGGTPVKSGYCHEMALRLLLHALQTSAARYRRYIVPMISCSIDFYIRVFVRVYTGPAQVKKTLCHTGVVYNCPACFTFHTDTFGQARTKGTNTTFHVSSGPAVDRNCEFCGHRYQLGGPAWLSPIHDPEFAQRMYQLIEKNKTAFGTHARMMGMVKVISEELHTSPFFYSLANLSGAIHCTTPPLADLCSALLHAGFKVSGSHTQPGSIKTNAPAEVMWDIMRCWAKKHPVALSKYGEESPAVRILSKKPTLEANFTRHPEAKAESRRINLVRYQENPEKNWGPKARHRKAHQVEK
ncbi:N2,N2-dimethylguanosine tRNA methyltransferase [Dimargaris cristalligena]|uniref:tRNA (guanine(26)-N(2))-dimethyltransferase n=1 Tax=Dimargaris cristalligena TaxID=215637 RepID=A0A4V1J4S7_9FUNG|nr:N2,N2-dimethylguanosine tRNA methyltransferase [Dimargaris cristalligena]|eukprot:RKP36599.1 N2,N2-dimethylguanosine tRNA methyltransferase [Dimargaris cristalligena]